VQAVGFRATARGVAAGHAVSGWVSNEPDGTVLMEIQGEAAAVEACVAELRGRMGRNIRGEDTVAAAVVIDERGFIIR